MVVCNLLADWCKILGMKLLDKLGNLTKRDSKTLNAVALERANNLVYGKDLEGGNKSGREAVLFVSAPYKKNPLNLGMIKKEMIMLGPITVRIKVGEELFEFESFKRKVRVDRGCGKTFYMNYVNGMVANCLNSVKSTRDLGDIEAYGIESKFCKDLAEKDSVRIRKGEGKEEKMYRIWRRRVGSS